MDQMLFTVPDAAKLLSVAEVTVWKWVYSRDIGSVQLGRSRRIPKEEIQRFIDKNFIPPRAN